MSAYYDTGGYTRKISTRSPEAQTWFDRGLTWAYGFYYEESARCFRRAVEADPDCAMAYWGIAYAVGPYYNRQWSALDPHRITADFARDSCCGRARPATQERCQHVRVRPHRGDCLPPSLGYGTG